MLWVLDLQDEIESDLSRFHRVDDPMQLSSSRYFRLAEQLVHYRGAVTAAVLAEVKAEQPVAPGSGGGAVVVDDVRTVASMTADSSFPGVEYVGG